MNFIGKFSFASLSSLAICESVNIEPLLTALITFGVSLITLAGGELIKYLVSYFKKKREDLENTKEKEK